MNATQKKWFWWVALVVILTLIVPWAVLADNTSPDGDGATPVDANPLDLGNVCTNSTISDGVLVAITRNGNYGSPNVFKTGSAVTISVLTVTGAGLSAIVTAPGTITLPSNWDTVANNTRSNAAPSTVQLMTGSGTGPFSGSVTYLATGVRSDNTTLTREAVMSVTAIVGTCAPTDTTPPTIDYTLTGTMGDNDWYVSDVTLTWTVTDPESAVTKTGCVDQNITTDQLATTYSCSATSTGGSSGPVNVTIKRDATKPTISAEVTPDAAATGWWNIDTGAPTVTYTCGDAMSDVASCTAPYIFGEGADQTNTGTAVDNAGNSNTATVENIDVDLTAPPVTATPDRPADNGDWYNHQVTVTFASTDSTATCDPVVEYTGPDSATASVSGKCTDPAGNEGTGTFDFKYDATKPTISAEVTPDAASTGWWNISTGAPTVTYTCDDATSGVASCTAPYIFPEGADQTNTGTAVDNAGNSETATVENIDVDLTAPTVTITTPAAGASYVLNAAVAADYECSDATSGIASCAGPVADGANIVTASVGAKSFKVDAADYAGNTNTATNNYSVTYAPAGTLCMGAPGHQILQPIDSGGDSVFKWKSTVPAKFRVCDANGKSIGPDPVVTSFKLVKTVSGTTVSTPNEDPVSTTPDTAFRWSATDQQWIFNINTKNLSSSKTYYYDITLNDGSHILFNFGLK